MNGKLNIAIYVLLFIFVGLGCGEGQKLGANTSEKGSIGNLFEGDNAAKAAQQIKEKAGGAVRVVWANVGPEKMEVYISSPKEPKEIDKYTVENGNVSGPERMRNFVPGVDLTSNGTISIDEIGWEAIPETIKRAIEVSKLANAKVVSVDMKFNGPEDKIQDNDLGPLTFAWGLLVKGQDELKTIWADKSGKVAEKMTL